jgi:hypothetical protein
LETHILKLTYGPAHDSMTVLKGCEIMKRFQRVMLNDVVIGSIEIHLQRVQETPMSNFGVVTVTRLHKADERSNS